MRVKAVKTRYWRPGEDYLEAILRKAGKSLRDRDIVVVSEKAISTAEGNIVDESQVEPGLLARFIAAFWMRVLWGYLLGRLCRFKPATLKRLRNYPIEEGAAHKQVVLDHAGLLQALKYGSEGGIDISNMPLAYACLPLREPEIAAERVCREIREKTGREVTVIIVDTDSTFTLRGLHFTSRPNPLKGIRPFGGALPFILGRALRLRQRATPLAVAGPEVTVEEALSLAEVAHHVRGYGAGRTVWDMAERFGVDFSEVTWEMLEEADHFPVVLIRRN